jgi:hypothetical protein
LIIPIEIGSQGHQTITATVCGGIVTSIVNAPPAVEASDCLARFPGSLPFAAVDESTTREQVLAEFAAATFKAFGGAHTADEFTDALEEGREAAAQVKALGDYILANVPGEPSQNQGAVETAIRLLDLGRDCAAQLVRLNDHLQLKDPTIGEVVTEAIRLVEGSKSTVGMLAGTPLKTTYVEDDVSYDLFRRVWPQVMQPGVGCDFSIQVAIGLTKLARTALEADGIVRPK